MGVKLGVVMDPIGSIQFKKDTTLAMLHAAQRKGWELHYFELGDLFVRGVCSRGIGRSLQVTDDPRLWWQFGSSKELALAELDVILMRKDPPFDMEYIYTTYLLEQAEDAGTLVVNKPRSLRDANEKLFALRFPQCIPPTLVTRDAAAIRGFLAEQGAIVLKPLEGMGGASVFKLTPDDLNVGVVIETLTNHGTRYTMAQRFIPEITAGDKRILMIDGEPVPYALARVPAKGELRGNLAAGGTGVGVELTDRDRWICEQVGPTLKEMGLIFVGLDVIGDYLTEINVTSPTCIRELDACFGLDIAGQLMDVIEEKLKARGRA